MSETSEDIEMLLAGLEVGSIAELKRLVDQARATATLVPVASVPIPGKPGWRACGDGIDRYSSAWLGDETPVSSETSRGAAERQPHGCEGQLQQ